MLDLSWTELALIAVVALLVIGPRDLPKALHMVGKWVRKARLLARDFQSSMDDMVRQAELEDLRKEVEKARTLSLKDRLEQVVDPDGDVREALTIRETPDGAQAKRLEPPPSVEDEAALDDLMRPLPAPATPVTTTALAPAQGSPAPASPTPGAGARPGPVLVVDSTAPEPAPTPTATPTPTPASQPPAPVPEPKTATGTGG